MKVMKLLECNPYPGFYPSLRVFAVAKGVLRAIEDIVGRKKELRCRLWISPDFLIEVEVPDEIIVACLQSRIIVPPYIVAKKLGPEGLPVVISDTDVISVNIIRPRLIGRP